MSDNFGFWLFNGKNGLLGKPNTVVTMADGRTVTTRDPENPAILQDGFIAHALHTARLARTDFTRLFPALDPDSQERLTDLILSNPKMTSLLLSDKAFHDAIQNRAVTEDIRLRLTRRTRTRNQGVEDRLR